MMKMPAIIVCLFICASCGQGGVKRNAAGSKPKSIDNWKTLDEKEYAVQYPPDWELNKSGQMGTSFFLLSPPENTNDQFRENANLLIQNVAGQNIDLDKYTSISEGQIKTMINNSKMIESKRINTGNEPYQKMIYTGDQGVYHLWFEQYYFILNDKAYVLTLTCEQDKSAAYKEKGENILNSFFVK